MPDRDSATTHGASEPLEGVVLAPGDPMGQPDPSKSHDVDLGPGFGIDRVSFSFPLTGFKREDWQRTGTSQGRYQWSRWDKLGGADVFMGAMTIPRPDGSEQLWGKVETNPSRIDDEHGCSLYGVRTREDWARLCEALWSAAGEWMRIGCMIEDARLKRLDVARDFRNVSAPSVYVHALLGERRKHARRADLHADPQRGNAQTLRVGSKSGLVRLYDQYEAYAVKGAPAGSLRFEVEAHAGWLAEKYRMPTLGDVTPEKVRYLGAERWEWSRMGVEVAGSATVVRRVQDHVRAGKVSQAVAHRFLGMLLCEAHGEPTKMSANGAAALNKLRKELGINVGADLFSAHVLPGTSGRLDYATGTEVAAVVPATARPLSSLGG